MAAPSCCASDLLVSLWGTRCHHVESRVSRLIPSMRSSLPPRHHIDTRREGIRRRGDGTPPHVLPTAWATETRNHSGSCESRNVEHTSCNRLPGSFIEGSSVDRGPRGRVSRPDHPRVPQAVGDRGGEEGTGVMGASGRTRVGGQGASRHLMWLLLLLALPAQGVFPGTVSGQVIDPAVRAGVAAGLTRVIIELRIAPPFTPEGDLPGAAVEAQRQTIARTQDDVIARLAGTSFAVSHRYEGLPLLSLEIGADALARLEGAGDLVARVLPDAPRFRQP